MGIHKDMQVKIQDAMRAKDKVKLRTLRGLSAEFTNELVAKKRKPNEELSDDDALSVISREAKKRKDSIDQFTKGNRSDLAEIESAELVILEKYLPEMISAEEVEKIVIAKKEELGIDDPTKKGILIGAVMKDLKGKADGNDVKTAVDKLFE